VENNVNVLVGANKASIIKETKRMLTQSSDFSIDLYGNGKACNNIYQELSNLL
jgi:UDP-GlcNAc3NAcA epimerase